MSEIEYPEWVPDEYIEASSMWERMKSLQQFEEEGVRVEWLIDGYGPEYLTNVSVKQYPVDGQDIEKIEAQFGGWEVGSYCASITKKDGEVMNRSLYEIKHDDYKYRGKLRSLRIGGIDDELVHSEMGWD